MEKEFKRLKKQKTNEIFDESSQSKILDAEGDEDEGMDAQNEEGIDKLLVS